MAFEDADEIMADPEETVEQTPDKPHEEIIIDSMSKVVVDSDHPFDLEGYVSQYSGWFAVKIVS